MLIVCLAGILNFALDFQFLSLFFNATGLEAFGCIRLTYNPGRVQMVLRV